MSPRTAAIGWTVGRPPALLSSVLERLGLGGSTIAEDVAVDLETADDAGRTYIELFTPTAHVIIEAKQSWIVQE